MKKAFTLIEILVVATIIGLLAAVASVSYTQFTTQSRDARRKADLENIRAALEMYRSNNSYYPLILTAMTTGTIYIKSIPADPLVSRNYLYQYEKLPAGCDNSTTICNDYTIRSKLENTSTCGAATSLNCISSPATACNYCLGPYGQIP